MEKLLVGRIQAHLRTPLYLNGYLLIAMRSSSTVFGFLFWAVAARFMPAADVGLATGVIAATMLLAGVAQLGLGYGLTRHLPQTADPSRLLNATLILSGLTGLILSLLFLALLQWLSPALLPLHSSPIHMISFVILVTSWSLSMLLHWIFVATRRVVYSFTRQAGHMAIAVVLLIIFRSMMPGFSAALFAHTIAVFLSVLFSLHALPKVQPEYRFTLPRLDLFKTTVRTPFARYSFVNYLADQFHRLPDTILPLLIINHFGPSKGAYFFVVWTIGSAMATWVGAMSQSLFAEGSHNPDMAVALTQRAAKLGLLLSSSMVVGMLLFGQWLLLIYGESYVEQGYQLLLFVSLAAIPRVLLSLFNSLLLIRERLAAMFTLRIVGSVVGLLLIYVGVIWFDFIGAGIGWLISQTVVLIAALGWWLWQERGQRRPLASAVTGQTEIQS